MSIDVFVIGKPIAQPRPRATIRGKHAGVYNPKTADAWKALVKEKFYKYKGYAPEGPLTLAVTYYIPRPKALCRKKDPTGIIPHTKKPDIDNLTKAVMDAISDIGVWGDDRQVSSLQVEKFYAAIDGPEGAHIKIWGK